MSQFQYGMPEAQKFRPSGICRRNVSHAPQLSPDQTKVP